MIIITKEDLKNLKILDGENKGSYGTCFLYENDKILKVYSNTMPFYYNKREIKRNIRKSLGLCVEGVSFPLDISKTQGYKFSYIMPFIEGVSYKELVYNLINTEFNMTFDDFGYLYHDAIYKANEISSLGIEMNDFHKDNCKIKEDFTIGIFDVDFYESKIIFNRFREKSLRYYNMLVINEAFYEMLNGFYNMKKKFINCQEKSNELECFYNIITDFPRNKPNYVDDILAKLNVELKKDSIKDLIIR